MRRTKCPECGSIHMILLEEDKIMDDGSWRADLKCGKCHCIIYEFGL